MINYFLALLIALTILDISTAHHESALKVGEWNVSITTDPAQHKAKNVKQYRHYRNDDDSDFDPKKVVKEVEEKIYDRIAKENNVSLEKPKHRVSVGQAKLYRRNRLKNYLHGRRYMREDSSKFIRAGNVKGKFAIRSNKGKVYENSGNQAPKKYHATERARENFGDYDNFNNYQDDNNNVAEDGDDDDDDDDDDHDEYVSLRKTNLGNQAPVSQRSNDAVNVDSSVNSNYNQQRNLPREDYYNLDDGDDDYDNKFSDGDDDGDDDEESNYREDMGKFEYVDNDKNKVLQKETENFDDAEVNFLEDPENYVYLNDPERYGNLNGPEKNDYMDDPENYDYMNDPENLDDEEYNLDDSGSVDIFDDGNDDDKDADGDDDDEDADGDDDDDDNENIQNSLNDDEYDGDDDEDDNGDGDDDDTEDADGDDDGDDDDEDADGDDDDDEKNLNDNQF